MYAAEVPIDTLSVRRGLIVTTKTTFPNKTNQTKGGQRTYKRSNISLESGIANISRSALQISKKYHMRTYTVNSHLTDTSLLGTRSKIPDQTYKETHGNSSRYYGIADTSCGPKLMFLFFFFRYNGKRVERPNYSTVLDCSLVCAVF